MWLERLRSVAKGEIVAPKLAADVAVDEGLLQQLVAQGFDPYAPGLSLKNTPHFIRDSQSANLPSGGLSGHPTR